MQFTIFIIYFMLSLVIAVCIPQLESIKIQKDKWFEISQTQLSFQLDDVSDDDSMAKSRKKRNAVVSTPEFSATKQIQVSDIRQKLSVLLKWYRCFYKNNFIRIGETFLLKI